MDTPASQETIKKMFAVIGNRLLALDIFKSIELALKYPFVFVQGERNVLGIFKKSLDAAIRDIESHPRGKLFQRLIEYGPATPDRSEMAISDGETTLSDSECGSCVEFIFSHMVNRFKGELAELLAIDPCISLIHEYIKDGRLPDNIQIHWGDMVQERREVSYHVESSRWGNFAKGADGLVVEEVERAEIQKSLVVYGIIEIKSMRISQRKILEQIDHHLDRLNGGLKLGEKMYPTENLSIQKPEIIKILVVPSSWKLSRQWQYKNNPDGSRSLVFPDCLEPPFGTKAKELNANVWKISLAWSQEALNQAAYEMTFWYMSQVGKHIFSNKNIPKGWEDMSPAEAGYNSIKMMLYYMLLRPLSPRQFLLATRLYNVYSFGYPLGVDNEEMMWPEDLSS